ncbi:dehydrin-like protein 3 [Stemphylium lycopersici]|nr:hypothetical protein TW65_08819 [Stemphylium lycopersici]RAR12048.1 dehydrin-like protein 3 [Stemphylium lycopersici]
MEKIKNVLHGHKKDGDAAHDSHQPTADGQQHPIYDEMIGRGEGKNAPLGQPVYDIKTTSGAPYTELSQPSGSAGLHGQEPLGRSEHMGTDGPIGTTATTTTGRPEHSNPDVPIGTAIGRPEHVGTDGPIGTATERPLANTSAPLAGTQRPDAYPHGHNQEPSVASIKSGVIGFGDHQGHAAMPTNNAAERSLAQDQVVGGENLGAVGMTQDRDVQPVPIDQVYQPQTSAVGHQPTTAAPVYAHDQQPYESTLRQESYITDTDRSFPLAGGVVSKPHDSPVNGSYGREGLAGAAAAATAVGASHTMSRPEEREVQTQGRETRQATYGDVPLAGAAATATPIGSSHTMSQPEDREIQNQGLETRQVTYGDVPPTIVSPTSTQTSTHVPSHQESEHHPGALAAATAAASNAASLPSTREKELETDNTGTALPTTEPVGSCERPINPRLESRHRHIPGEFIATPSDESKTFLSYESMVDPTTNHAGGNVPVQSPLATTTAASSEPLVDPAANPGSHELRHTGTLEEPRPKSAEGDHHARDAAIAGGLGAGASGLGAQAASMNRETRDVGENKFLHEESSPYSSKVLDPRVLGDKPKLQEQRFDPKVKSDHGSGSAVSGPPVSHEPRQVATTEAGYGAQDAVNAYGDHKMTQPSASMPGQRYDPTMSSARASNPVAARTEYDYNNPTTLGNVNRTDPDDHINRNAAFGGAGLAGAAALGAGAYTREPHAHDQQQLPLRQKQEVVPPTQTGTILQPVHPTQNATHTSYPLQDTSTHTSYPSQGTIAPHNTHIQDPVREDHDARNAAVLGGTVGAAGVGGAAYIDNRHQNELEAEDRLKKIAVEREKEQRHHEKDFEKENETEEKKKHRLLGFLHRDKSKKERSSASPESSPRQSRDYSPRHSKDYSDEPDSPRWKGKHRLHKDPPKGHPAREALEQPHESDPLAPGKRQHMGTDGLIGDPDAISGDRETRKGVYGAHPITDLDHNPTVIEPHTGLPMNTERFGTGAGGIEGNPAIHGQHSHSGPMAGQTGADWEAIRKADTPY